MTWAGKRTNRCFRRALNAKGFHAKRGLQGDGSPILQQQKLAAGTIRLRRRPENYNRANILWQLRKTQPPWHRKL